MHIHTLDHQGSECSELTQLWGEVGHGEDVADVQGVQLVQGGQTVEGGTVEPAAVEAAEMRGRGIGKTGKKVGDCGEQGVAAEKRKDPAGKEQQTLKARQHAKPLGHTTSNCGCQATMRSCYVTIHRWYLHCPWGPFLTLVWRGPLRAHQFLPRLSSCRPVMCCSTGGTASTWLWLRSRDCAGERRARRSR